MKTNYYSLKQLGTTCDITLDEFLKAVRTNDASDLFVLTKEGDVEIKDLETGKGTGEPEFRGVFMLEHGYMDIEVNLSAYSDNDDRLIPHIDFFCCRKYGEGKDDWESDNYIDSELSEEEIQCTVDFSREDWDEQLKQDMMNKLLLYCERKKIDYTKPV